MRPIIARLPVPLGYSIPRPPALGPGRDPRRGLHFEEGRLARPARPTTPAERAPSLSIVIDGTLFGAAADPPSMRVAGASRRHTALASSS
jgi:hypothetical protein